MMSDLFNSGQRPAIDPGLSVSRVGSTAQIKAIKKVAGSLKLELAQYREMAAFTQFGSDLDPATKSILDHGSRVLEIIKQKQFTPYKWIDQIIILLSLKERITNVIPVNSMSKYREYLIKYFDTDKKAIKTKEIIFNTKDINDENKKLLISAILNCTKNFIRTIVNYDEQLLSKAPSKYKDSLIIQKTKPNIVKGK